MSEAVKHENLVEALAAAQGEFGEILTNKTADAGKYSYPYADLGQVLAVVRPVLSRHGLAISWIYRREADQAEVVTRLLHPSGETLETSLPVFFDRTMQSLGSALTYAKRYGLVGLVGVVAEDDDDGKRAGTEGRPAEDRQQANGQKAKSTRQQRPAEQTTEPAEPEKKPQTFTLDQFKKTIDGCKNPDRLVTFIDKCGAMQQLIADQDLAQGVFDHAADVLRSHRESGTWEADACDFLSKRLGHNYNALAMEWEAAKPPLTFETIAAQIDGIIKSQGLCEYLTRAESSETLLSDIPLLKRLIEKAGQVAYARLQGGKWKATEVDEVEAIISRIKLKIDGTKPETSGTQGELIP